MNASLLHALLAQTSLPALSPEGGTAWLPPQAATTAHDIDAVFYFIYWVSVFFFVLIVALIVYFVIRYRQRTAGDVAVGRTTHNTTLELVWTGIPLVLVGIMFYMGVKSYVDVTTPPKGAEDIRVLGQKWVWTFTYPNGVNDTELHVPVGRPIRLILESNDVIHSLFIPAFRVKRDVVPGRYNKVWFTATTPGEYLAVCSEFCGTKHSEMVARVVVHEPGMYEQWLAEVSDPFKTRTPAQVGALIVARRCSGCHTVDGTANIGPSFKGIYEHPVTLDNGQSVTADDDYIRESILLPQAKIVKGFGKEMPSFKGQLKDKEITAIIEYIKERSQ